MVARHVEPSRLIEPNLTLHIADSPVVTSESSTETDDTTRQLAVTDALKKLNGQTSEISSSTTQPSTASKNDAPTPSKSTSLPSQPVSLAAIIGGRASGPRLNKHAPQEDAHDPTKFDPVSIRPGRQFFRPQIHSFDTRPSPCFTSPIVIEYHMRQPCLVVCMNTSFDG